MSQIQLNGEKIEELGASTMRLLTYAKSLHKFVYDELKYVDMDELIFPLANEVLKEAETQFNVFLDLNGDDPKFAFNDILQAWRPDKWELMKKE